MRFILFILLILNILAVSCANKVNNTQAQKPKDIERPKKYVRAMWVVDKGKGYEPIDSNVAIIQVDTLFRVGDVIPWGYSNSTYRIID